ncbi:MAG: NUDIX hydrolase [Candidatus Gracilibacteria bacterium]|nr:NUDIX hydrolase [Candidatus Gracilibacteria bacterium]
MPKFKKLSEKIILDNGYRKIISKDFEVKDGKIYNYFVTSLSYGNIATMILPITKHGEIVYIKEFRVGIENYVYSFPVGVLENGLSLEENARKELREETGFEGGKLEYLGETIVENYEDIILKYFFINDCEFGKQNLENGEDIEVFTCSIEEFEEMIKSGKINCPLALSCYTFAKLKGYV